MLHSPEILTRFEKLFQSGMLSTDFRPGGRFARSFADVGFEEFLILPNGALCSLVSGQKSSVGAEHDEHLFPVLSEEEMIQALSLQGATIVSLEYVEQREWELLLHYKGEAQTFRETKLQGVFLAALEKVAGC